MQLAGSSPSPDTLHILAALENMMSKLQDSIAQLVADDTALKAEVETLLAKIADIPNVTAAAVKDALSGAGVADDAAAAAVEAADTAVKGITDEITASLAPIPVAPANPSPPTQAVASLSFSPTSLSGGPVGTTVSDTFVPNGGTAPYSYSVSAGSVPSGLSLDATGGTITGAYAEAGDYAFTVTVTDASTPPKTGSQDYKIGVTAPA